MKPPYAPHVDHFEETFMETEHTKTADRPQEQQTWMPQITAAHKKLEALAGSWVGEETLYPSPWLPEGGTANAKVESRLDLDGFFLLTNYEEAREGRVTYRGHGVYGWDEGRQEYSMFWFDSMGGPGPSAPAWGTWNGDTLEFRHATPHGPTRYVYVFDRPNSYRFRIENSQDGTNWKPFMEARYTRAL
jgi:hypothetical protein